MRTVLHFLWLGGIVFGLVLLALWLDRRMGWQGLQATVPGAALTATGLAMMLWCIFLFVHLARGTPHPFAAKTKRLVVVGPYRYVRNPMAWGGFTLVAGTALWSGSVGLWFFLGLLMLFVRWFVPYYEEPDMERRFGEEYRDYCRRVPRWLPRFR